MRTVDPNLSEAFRQTRMAFRFRITRQQISSARFAAPCSNGRREFEYTRLWLEKIPGRTHHDRSGRQLLVIRKRIPEKHLCSHNLCDDFTGRLGTQSSSRRFKDDITSMEKASEALLSLRPVTFHYKNDVKATPQFGLIAEEVAKVNPALVVPDKEGKPYSVRYDQVNAMLLNEFLKEHRAFLEEQCKVERLEKQVAALTAGLQKVSAQMAAASPSLADSR